MEHLGDRIEFLADGAGTAPADGYADVTEAVIEQLVAAGILRDDGVRWRDEDEPEIHWRALENVWMHNAPPGDRVPPG